MPYTVRNTFQHQTPLGAGIQALTRGLFGGATPEEQEAKLATAEYARAHADQARALTAAAQQKMAREKASDAAMAAAPAEVIAGMFGGKPQGDAIMAFRNGVQVDAPMGTGMTGSLDEQDIPAAKMAAPRPEFYTPDMEARANRTLAGISAARALPGNDTAAHLAKIIEGFYNDDIRQRAVSGNVSVPTLQRIGQASAAVAGKPLFNDGQFGATSNFTGEIVDPRLFNAAIALSGEKKNTEVAHQGAYRGQANASNAAAGLSTAKTDDVKESKKMIQLVTPEGYGAVDNDGKPIMVRNDKAGEIYAKGLQDRRSDADKPQRPTAAGKAAPLRKLTKNDTDLMRRELDNLLTDLDATDIDGQTRNAILTAAENGWVGSTKGHAGVIKDALDSVAPQGFQSKSGIPGFRKKEPKGGVPAAPPAGQAGPMITPQGIPPAAQRQQGQVYDTPKGKMTWTGTGWVPAGGA
jgi:hypothetical protein